MKKILNGVLEEYKIDIETFELLLMDYSEQHQNYFNSLINDYKETSKEIDQIKLDLLLLRNEKTEVNKKEEVELNSRENSPITIFTPEITTQSDELLKIYGDLKGWYNAKIPLIEQSLQLNNTKLELYQKMIDGLATTIIYGNEELFNEICK